MVLLSFELSLQWMLLGLLGVGLALATWFFVLTATSFECSFDTSNCASTHALREYRGRLYDYEGRPAARFVLTFQSELYGRQFGAPVRTDDQGRFCVRAIPGDNSAYIQVTGQTHASQLIVRSSAPVDPRFWDPKVLESLRRRESGYRGLDRMAVMTVEPSSPDATPASPSIWPTAAHYAPGLWDPSSDAASSCQGVGKSAPWYKFDDAKASWQFAVLTLASLVTLALFVVGIVVRETARPRRSIRRASLAERAFKGSLAMGIATMLLAWVLWAIA